MPAMELSSVEQIKRIIEISNKKTTRVAKEMNSRKRTIDEANETDGEKLSGLLRQLHKKCIESKSDTKRTSCRRFKTRKINHHQDTTTHHVVVKIQAQNESIIKKIDANCEICKILFDISKVYNEAGQSMQEFEFYVKCISILEKCRENIQNGHNLNDLWLSLNNLGHLFYSTHHYDEALHVFMVAMKFLKENCAQSKYNHAKASILNNIGFVYLNMSVPKKDKALLYFEKSLEQFKLTPITQTNKLLLLLGTVLNNIGKCHYGNEHYEKAKIFYRSALTLRGSLLGLTHLDVGATVFNLGQLYHKTGDFELARVSYLYFLNTVKLSFGHDSHLLITALSWLGKLHSCMQKYTDANRYYFQALRVCIRYLGQGHSDITILWNRIGDIFYKLGNLDESLQSFQKALKNELCSDSSCTEKIEITLFNIGKLYQDQGNVDKSIKIYQIILELQKKIGDPKLIKTHKILGYMMSEESRYLEALVHYHEVLKLHEKDHNDHKKYKSLMTTMGNIGFLSFKIGKYGQALKFLNEALVYNEKIPHECNKCDAKYIFFNIAMIYNQLGEQDLAIEYFETTLQIDRDILGPDHIGLAEYYNQIGQVYVNKGEIRKALKCFEEKLRIEKVSGYSHYSIETLNAIGDLCVLTGNVHRIMDVYSELREVNCEQISFLGNLVRYAQNGEVGRPHCLKTAPAA